MAKDESSTLALLEAAERNLINAERRAGTPDYAALATAYATIAIARSIAK